MRVYLWRGDDGPVTNIMQPPLLLLMLLLLLFSLELTSEINFYPCTKGIPYKSNVLAVYEIAPFLFDVIAREHT